MMSPSKHPRNDTRPLEPSWFETTQVNLSALERRSSSLGTRRTVKKQWQAAWLLKAISCIDLTTLAGDDTAAKVKRLCAKARQPVRKDILHGLGMADAGLSVAAICVYPSMVPHAVKALEGSSIPVASVATGFPAGLTPFKQRLEEIHYAVNEGAEEIDIVISREYALTGQWDKLYDEIRMMREACGKAHLKTILATGELGHFRNVYKASMVCMQAGADFIKTSTGKEGINATLPTSLVMVRAIRDYQEKTGLSIGFKPAGGIRTAKDAMNWQFLMREELGRDWLEPELFRFGASSLLTDIERQLEHYVTGRYSAAYKQPLG